MLQVTLNVTLTLEGPILTKSSTPGRYGIDASMAVNHEGKYSIPGTLVKGRLRQSWKELRDAASYIPDDEIKRLLGKRSGSAENAMPVTPYRGILKFSDFVSAKEETQVLHRIRMDEDRGAVDTGALLMMETPFAPGEKACFHGTISFAATDQTETSRIKDYVEKGLKWTTSLGSGRTVGFGKLINVDISQTIEPVRVTAPQIGTFYTGNGRLSLVITPHAPFCIAKSRISQNLFESETIISGGVIKGTIASAWGQLLGKRGDIEIDGNFDQDRKELCRHFENIRFTHAFPAKPSELKRPVSPPLSLVKVKKDESYYDVALCDTPVLVSSKAPAFDIDWKDRSDVEKDFGWANLQKELRVRTAIDKNRRKAKEEQLFAYEMVTPVGFHWLAWVDLGLVPEEDRAAVEGQLRGLLAYGLRGLGKTKASADVELKEPSLIKPVYCSKLEPLGGQYIVTLQTPAILCDPGNLDETSDRSDLLKAYGEVWSQLSDDSLSLVRYFARQILAGSYYLHKRFQNDKPYEPYLLTEAGSVFVLKVETGETAREKIEEWFKHGLPLPEWAREKYRRNGKEGDHWSNCPYIRENGYGEIAVNMQIHISKRPEEIVKCHLANDGA